MIDSTEHFLLIVSVGHRGIVCTSLSGRLLGSPSASCQDAANPSTPAASAPMCLPEGAVARAVPDFRGLLHYATQGLHQFTVQ